MGKQKKSPINIDTTKCTPCIGIICVGVCPQAVFEEGKNRKPEIIDVVECTQCGVCVSLCPTKAITITKS